MKRKSEVIPNILAFIIACVMLWGFLSWADVVFNRPNICKWNLFKVITAHAETKALESELAKHEQYKGEAALEFISEFRIDEKNLDILARIIETEVGAPYLDDSLSYRVGSVFLNRVKSDKFPDTFYEVAHQEGQYANAGSPVWYNEPSDRSKQIAQELLEHGSCLPPEVIWQANFPQGKGIYLYQDGIYFCY